MASLRCRVLHVLGGNRNSQRISSTPRLVCRWFLAPGASCSVRCLHVDKRSRLSRIWVPHTSTPTAEPNVVNIESKRSKSKKTAKDMEEDDPGLVRLVHAGLVQQSTSGIFHLLPLGLRVQNKIEALIDEHMRSIGASRIALSSIAPVKLWEESGRLTTAKELFQFEDRKKRRYLLSPTHEEVVTKLVKTSTRSYKSLPIRLYQITRKYRDELRPRKGLLRAREFTMKDLYTFDVSTASAMATYNQVRAAYDNIFAELGIPVVSSEASSGDMGGDISHEYHMISPAGEDEVVKCGSCGYAANIEVAQEGQSGTDMPNVDSSAAGVSTGVSNDMDTVVNVWYPLARPDSSGVLQAGTVGNVNVHNVEAAVGGGVRLQFGHEERLRAALARATELRAPRAPAGDAAGNEPMPMRAKPRLINLVDKRLLGVESAGNHETWTNHSRHWPAPAAAKPQDVAEKWDVIMRTSDSDGNPLDLVGVQEGGPCPRCSEGQLSVETAIELGHTFHLGTRYSAALGATVMVPDARPSDDVDQARDAGSKPPAGAGTVTPMQMGCHGIGVSRIIGAVANREPGGAVIPWPRAIAPYEVVVVPFPYIASDVAEEVYDVLAAPGQSGPLDVLLDDRAELSGPWRLKDAGLVGYPVVIVIGALWKKGLREVEVQCPRLGLRENVRYDELRRHVRRLLLQLDGLRTIRSGV